MLTLLEIWLDKDVDVDNDKGKNKVVDNEWEWGQDWSSVGLPALETIIA